MRRQQIGYPLVNTPSVGRRHVFHISGINVKSGNERGHTAPRQLKLLNRKENNLMFFFSRFEIIPALSFAILVSFN